MVKELTASLVAEFTSVRFDWWLSLWVHPLIGRLNLRRQMCLLDDLMLIIIIFCDSPVIMNDNVLQALITDRAQIAPLPRERPLIFFEMKRWPPPKQGVYYLKAARVAEVFVFLDCFMTAFFRKWELSRAEIRSITWWRSNNHVGIDRWTYSTGCWTLARI